ncbi:hypothetical protein DFP96_1224 [Listeria rocourtiae]|uniref:Uncharacterized protein n=1 Tax=Listeria rocourtiae TaxID=647910 RepID=A0A4R6ZE07_9LIST|nr:hypothetical protein DFP96_1224 [Listeria rocourtiae]
MIGFREKGSGKFLCYIVNLSWILFDTYNTKRGKMRMWGSLLGALFDLAVTAIILAGQFVYWLILFIKYQIWRPYRDER